MDLYVEIPKLKSAIINIDKSIEEVRNIENCDEKTVTIQKLKEAHMWLSSRYVELYSKLNNIKNKI